MCIQSPPYPPKISPFSRQPFWRIFLPHFRKRSPHLLEWEENTWDYSTPAPVASRRLTIGISFLSSGPREITLHRVSIVEGINEVMKSVRMINNDQKHVLFDSPESWFTFLSGVPYPSSYESTGWRPLLGIKSFLSLIFLPLNPDWEAKFEHVNTLR